MAPGGPRLLMCPVALVLLVSASWGLRAVLEELHKVAGQTLSVRCQYPPERGPYVKKTWCRQTSPGKCTRLVTTSQPRTAVQKAEHMIWDDPHAGFFLITVAQLREEDAGPYWCGSFNSSLNVVTIFRNITLVVSPASSSSAWTTTWLPMTTALITPPEGTSSPSINGSEHRNSSSPSSLGSASSELLLSVQCGLLLVKGLVLSILCVLLSFQRHQGHRTLRDSDDGGL